MNTSKKLLVVIFILSSSLSYSQEKENKIPISIYSSSLISKDYNNLLFLNERLNLKSFSFLTLNKSFELGFPCVSFDNIFKKPSNYVYETYQKANHTLNLQKAFFKVSDLYRVREKNSI